MPIIIASKGKKNSIFNHPKVKRAIEKFNPNDPKFIKALQERNKESKDCFDEMERKKRESERRMALNCHIPIRSRERD